MNQSFLESRTNSSLRRYDIDWLRVIAIILVLYFHTAMIFVTDWSWHIKNPETSNLWQEFNFFLSRFRMPLLFFISGVGSVFALRKRSGWQYIKERHNRLIIPLVFGMLVIVPPQIYFERLFQGVDYSSFWAFYPSTFEMIPYPEGNLSWHHLWFVLYLFVYSAAALPIFVFLKSERGKRWISKNLWLSSKYGLYALTIPTVIIYVTLFLRFPETHNLVHDGFALPYYFTFFVIGYLVASHENFWERISENRRLSLGLGILLILVVNYIRWNGLSPWAHKYPGWENSLYTQMYLAMRAELSWVWIFAALGYAKVYLNKKSAILSYANRGIYPFYIIHQTIIVIIGYYVIQVEESIFAKFMFISTISLVLSIAFYEFIVRPFRIARFLFGVKELKKSKEEKVLEKV